MDLTLSYIKGLKEHNVLAVSVEGMPCGMPAMNDQEAELILEESIRVQAMTTV